MSVVTRSLFIQCNNKKFKRGTSDVPPGRQKAGGHLATLISNVDDYAIVRLCFEDIEFLRLVGLL